MIIEAIGGRIAGQHGFPWVRFLLIYDDFTTPEYISPFAKPWLLFGIGPQIKSTSKETFFTSLEF